VAVHDVDMQKLGSRLFDLANIVTESGEVSGKDGWSNAYVH
jgi:hypothetical protein